MNGIKKPRSPRGSGNDLINGDYKQLPVSVSQILYDEVATLAAAYYKTHGYSGRKPRGNGTALFAKELLLLGIKEFKRVQQQNVVEQNEVEH